MKILLVSMASIHFFRWAEQLRNSDHEIFWIDVFDSGEITDKLDFVQQTIGWKNIWDYPGRYLIKRRTPMFYRLLNKLNQIELSVIVEKKIKDLQPDIIHSFILQSGTFPLKEVMKKYPKIKWVYSAWGNDLHYRQQNEKDLEDIKSVLPHLDFMFADCTRDYIIAKENGFKGRYLGTFPTGGGYDLTHYNNFIQPQKDRMCILIKGYQGKLGRCNNVLKAIANLKSQLKSFRVITFGANDEVQEYCESIGLKKWKNFELYYQLPHNDVLKLMGQSLMYIGNSISDGLPNTLLEAIIMESFPIQSNPGGATSEIIADGENGLLINDVENDIEIKHLIIKGLTDQEMVKKAISHNSTYIKPFLDREYIKKEVLNQYNIVSKEVMSHDNNSSTRNQ